MFCAFHDQLASLDRHAQLTRCFSAVAELLVLKSSNKKLHRLYQLACAHNWLKWLSGVFLGISVCRSWLGCVFQHWTVNGEACLTRASENATNVLPSSASTTFCSSTTWRNVAAKLISSPPLPRIDYCRAVLAAFLPHYWHLYKSINQSINQNTCRERSRGAKVTSFFVISEYFCHTRKS